MSTLANTPAYLYSSMFVEGFLCGVYSGIFALYLHCHAAKAKEETGGNTRKIIFYALCVLYLLTAVVYVLDILGWAFLQSSRFQFYYALAQPAVFGCCDFIAQSILIYRCWIVWNCNIRIVIVPSILALAYLGLWLAAADGAAFLMADGSIGQALWGQITVSISVAFSMAVNALVTGLIVYRIFKVFQEVRQSSTSADKSLGIVRGRKSRSVIFVVIESGIALFAIQLLRVILTNISGFAPFYSIPIDVVLNHIIVIHQMFNGITPTIVLVRVSMGLSFDNERSLEKVAGSFCFASIGQIPNSIPEIGNIDRQEWRDNEIDGPGSEDI